MRQVMVDYISTYVSKMHCNEGILFKPAKMTYSLPRAYAVYYVTVN